MYRPVFSRGDVIKRYGSDPSGKTPLQSDQLSGARPRTSAPAVSLGPFPHAVAEGEKRVGSSQGAGNLFFRGRWGGAIPLSSVRGRPLDAALPLLPVAALLHHPLRNPAGLGKRRALYRPRWRGLTRCWVAEGVAVAAAAAGFHQVKKLHQASCTWSCAPSCMSRRVDLFLYR